MIARLFVEPGIPGADAARWTAATLLDVTECAWHVTMPGDLPPAAAALGARAQSPVGTGDPLVFVGSAEHAPADAAAVLPWDVLTPWPPGRLELATLDGVTLPCPDGRVEPPPAPHVLPAPWLRTAYALLSREEERLVAERDRWNCFPGTSSRLYALGALERPLLNALAARIEALLHAWAERRGARIEPRPRWPRDARFAVALTHDVDELRYASLRDGARLLALARGPRAYALRAGLTLVGRRLRSPGRRDDPYWTFDRWVAAEEARGFRSSFYFCAPRPRRTHEYDATYRLKDPVRFEGRIVRVRDLAARLAARGFEVGLHGSYDSYRDAELLRREKRAVEEAAGRPVTGTRQHFLRFAPDETWAAQEMAGFTVDSTLGYNEAIGFRAGLAAPFSPFDPTRRRGRGLLELPLSVMDGTLFRTLGLDGHAAAERAIAHLTTVREAGGLAVLLWHPNGAAEARYPGWWAAWERILDWLAGQPAWVTDAGTIADWWRGRAAGEGEGAAPQG